jgi:VanZ family protein
MAPPPSHSPRTVHFCFAVLVVVALSVAAYSGRIPSFVTGHGIDKVLHATMGATLTFLLARLFRGRAVLAALLVLAPLAADEYLQRFSPMRSSDWGDLAADVMGALLAVAIHRALSRARYLRSVRHDGVHGFEDA